MEFEVDERGWQETADSKLEEHAEWTQLQHKQCANCPLSTDDCKFCPVAVDIEEIAARFKEIIAHTQTKVTVIDDHRTYYKEVNVQAGLQSLFGLIMARSHCPHLGRLRILAQNHLPFGTPDEALRRMAGAYLTKQYHRWVDGEEPDFALYGIEDMFKDLQSVNESLALRLKDASSKDASINAVLEFVKVTKSGSTIWENLERQKEANTDGF